MRTSAPFVIRFTYDHFTSWPIMEFGPDPGMGKRHRLQVRAARKAPTIHHVTRQQRRRAAAEQAQGEG